MKTKLKVIMPSKLNRTRKRPSQKRSRKRTGPNYVRVANKSYGGALQGIKVYWEGLRPKSLRDDGSIKFGKNILEILRKRFDHFRQ